MRPARVLPAVALLLAGCLSAPADEATTPATIPPLDDLLEILVADHDHADPALHRAVSPNVQSTGFTDLALDGPTDSNTALDVVDGWAVVGHAGASSGFTLVDLADPAAPKPVSHFRAPNTYGADVKFNADASLVFLATQYVDPANPTNLLKYDAVALAENPMIWGVYVVDVSDKASPRLESFLPVGVRGAHSVHYHEIGGKPYVFATTYHFVNAVVSSEENPVATKVVVAELAAGPDGQRRLTPVAEYTRNVDVGVIAAREGRVFPHELSVSEAPMDGKTYAWVSYWDHGLVVLDLSDPANPVVAGEWAGFEPGDGAIHYSATFPELLHGRQVTVVGPEWYSHDSSGKWWLLDTTDLADIRTIGWWTLPGSPAFDGKYRFSPHNFDLVGSWVVGANYHGGVWIWDVDRLVKHFNPGLDPTPDNATAPLTPSSFRVPLSQLLHGESEMDGHGDVVDVVGYLVEGRTPRASYFGGEAPFVWAALVRDGHVVYSDMESGLGVARLADLAADADGMFLKGHAGHS